MSSLADHLPEPRSGDGGRVVLWGAAVLLAVAGHGGATFWMLQRPAPPGADADAPPAVMIELAPAAAPAPEVLPSPDVVDRAERLDAAPPADSPPPPPLDVASDLPELDAPTPLADPLAAEQPPPLDLPPPPPDAVALPQARPAARPKPEAPAEQKPVEKAKPASSKAAVRAASPDAAPQPTTAPSAASQAGGGTPARWQARLMAHLERLKRYPAASRDRREEGTVLVRFSIDDAGRVLTVELQRSSGFQELDAAVLALVRRASPVPAPPDGAPRSISAPVRFYIR